MTDAVRTVFFDVDGTLVDTTALILASCEHTFGRFLKGGCPPREALVATFGRSLPELLHELAVAEAFPDPAAAAAEMLSVYRAHNLEHHDTLIRPFDGVTEMLAALQAAGFRLGVVSSKTERSARRGLRCFDLERFFAVGVFHDDTEKHKPHPEPLEAAARAAGVEPSRALYVGDSVHDVAAGRAAGMRTAAALWGPFDRAVLEAAGPDHLLAHPSEVTTLVLGLARGPG